MAVSGFAVGFCLCLYEDLERLKTAVAIPSLSLILLESHSPGITSFKPNVRNTWWKREPGLPGCFPVYVKSPISLSSLCLLHHRWLFSRRWSSIQRCLFCSHFCFFSSCSNKTLQIKFSFQDRLPVLNLLSVLFKFFTLFGNISATSLAFSEKV